MAEPTEKQLQEMVARITQAKDAVNKCTARKQAAVQALVAAMSEDDIATEELAKWMEELQLTRRAARKLGFTLLDTVVPMPETAASPAMTPSTPNGKPK